MGLRFVTIPKFAELSGYTPDAVRSKIRDGIWKPGREFIKAPDGRVLIDTEGFSVWVETGEGYAPHQKAAYKLRSSTRGNAAAKSSRSSPPPLI